MNAAHDWRTVHGFWFPPGLDEAGLERHRRMLMWWMGGGANAELAQFAPVLDAAKAGRLDPWLATPLGRLSLIVVLDQFPRGLFAGTPQAFACDAAALRMVEEGLRNGHYEALAKPWEKTFFLMPLGHAEGPDHLARLERVVGLVERIALEAPEQLKPLFQHSVRQARGHRDVISRFGRFPHRNSVLGRVSNPDELAYLEKGDFVYNRQPPQS